MCEAMRWTPDSCWLMPCYFSYWNSLPTPTKQPVQKTRRLRCTARGKAMQRLGFPHFHRLSTPTPRLTLVARKYVISRAYVSSQRNSYSCPSSSTSMITVHRQYDMLLLSPMLTWRLWRPSLSIELLHYM